MSTKPKQSKKQPRRRRKCINIKLAIYKSTKLKKAKIYFNKLNSLGVYNERVVLKVVSYWNSSIYILRGIEIFALNKSCLEFVMIFGRIFHHLSLVKADTTWQVDAEYEFNGSHVYTKYEKQLANKWTLQWNNYHILFSWQNRQKCGLSMLHAFKKHATAIICIK